MSGKKEADTSGFAMTELLQQGKEAHRAGRLDEAERLYKAALSADPRNGEAMRLMGAILAQRQDFPAAEQILAGAIDVAPQEPSAHYNLALVRLQSGRLEEALPGLERTLALNPGHAPARKARARALVQTNRPAEALAEYDRLLAQAPVDTGILYRRGMVLLDLRRASEALDSFNRALMLQHESAPLIGRAVALQMLRRVPEAIEAFQQALGLGPDLATLHMGLGHLFLSLGRYEEAVAAYEQAYARDAAVPWLAGNLHYAKMKICDWRDFESDREAICEAVRRSEPAASTLVTIADDPELQQQCARLHAAKFLNQAAPAWEGKSYRHDRIRVAYISKDLGDHANIVLAAELFERHDRSQFETHAVSLGPNDGSKLRNRLEAAFEHFHQVDHLDDIAVVALLRELEIDIAVDLDGYSVNARPRIFALRPAPVSVNFLGYPGTVGAPYMDYIIADRIIVPEQDRKYYDERVVYMPHTYQTNTRRLMSDAPSERKEAGLPEHGFVFCCFNNLHKITPVLFDSWMRLLKKADGSVLWLYGSDPVAQVNLRREAEGRGVAGERIVFASRLDADQHLARHKMADLFLDTLPYNAHTTASDALWAGLPVVTCKGKSFPGRVAASILSALGMEELVTSSLDEYESLALALAQDKQRLAEIKERILRNRDTHPLFNCAAYTRDLESAYRTMWQRQQSGEGPEGFGV